MLACLYSMIENYRLSGAAWGPIRLALMIVLMAMMFAVPHLAGVSREALLSSAPSKIMIVACLAVTALAATLSLKGPFARVAGFLGDISYALYLVHYLVWRQVMTLPGMSLGVKATISVITSVVLAALIFRFFETPARSLRIYFMSDQRVGGTLGAGLKPGA